MNLERLLGFQLAYFGKKINTMKNYILFIVLILIISCNEKNVQVPKVAIIPTPPITNTSIVILGTIQDAGSPHIGCKKKCCKELFEKSDYSRKVISLGLYDSSTQKKYLFEATPDLGKQLKKLKKGIK